MDNLIIWIQTFYRVVISSKDAWISGSFGFRRFGDLLSYPLRNSSISRSFGFRHCGDLLSYTLRNSCITKSFGFTHF
jgi:hypothetical protein